MKARPIHVLAAGFALALGCTNTIDSPSGGTGTGTGTPCTGAVCACGSDAAIERISAQSAVTQVDLVLMVDNGGSSAEKQNLFALAVPELIEGLVNPRCLDSVTHLPVAMQPSSGVEPCPAGSTREFVPVADMHVGVLSSSLGTFGANGCPDEVTMCGPGITNDDHGHLVTRSDLCGQMAPVPTYQNLGFLAWDPLQKETPPGESDVAGLTTALHDIVVGDGNLGCGFRSQNESWYRFLVDPTPYQTIALVNNEVQTSGVDTALLQQRKDFLRPGSLLAIIAVTDHTDASVKEYSSYPLFDEPSLHLPVARTECTTKGPTDPCCASCGQATPAGCPTDPVCSPPNNSYTDASENTALRAFGLVSHKARYGIEFFYQPSRYVQALTSSTVADANGKMVPNPIYSILDPSQPGAAVRDPSMVLYATITGVPWQLIARQSNGVPDLISGVDKLDPTQVGGFKTAAELALTDGQGHTFWDDIVGDPENYVPPLSPFMQESLVPRVGVDPITGIATAPPTAATGANPINGHERTIAQPAGDVEYACIFPSVDPLDCTDPSVGYCECSPGTTGNPLCDPNPADSGNPTLQTRSKAYPGLKNLAIAKGMGDQGVVASICAKQITDNTAADYGYRPAVQAILGRLRGSLHGAELGGQCLPRSLPVDGDGLAACNLIEATHTPGPCDCTGAARAPVPAEDQCFVTAAQQDPLDATAQWNCFCEIEQESGAALTDCQTQPVSTTDGWCYVDATTTPPVGNPALVSACPASSERELRFVGQGAPRAGATVFLACH